LSIADERGPWRGQTIQGQAQRGIIGAVWGGSGGGIRNQGWVKTRPVRGERKVRD